MALINVQMGPGDPSRYLCKKSQILWYLKLQAAWLFMFKVDEITNKAE